MVRLLQALMLLACLMATGCARYVDPVFSEGPEPYLLAPGDRLRIIVYGQDNLSNLYGVDPSGRVSMPLIGPVSAAGSTVRDLERTVEAKLREGFIREPRVAVEVDTFRPFYVLGEVQAAGQFPFAAGMTVQKAVALAGGFSPRADQHVARVTRIVRGVPVVADVPITQPVRPGDTIVIHERWF